MTPWRSRSTPASCDGCRSSRSKRSGALSISSISGLDPDRTGQVGLSMTCLSVAACGRGVLGGASDEGLSTVPKPALAEKSSAAEGRRMSRPSIGAGPVMVEPQGEEGGGTGGGGGGGGGEVGSTASGMGSVATTASPTASPGIKKGVTFGAEVAMGQGRAKVAPDNDDKLRKPGEDQEVDLAAGRERLRDDLSRLLVHVDMSFRVVWGRHRLLQPRPGRATGHRTAGPLGSTRLSR